MFAIAAAIVALLAIVGVGSQELMLWIWLGFIALHFAFGSLWTVIHRNPPPQ